MKVLDLVNDISGALFNNYLHIYTKPSESLRDQLIKKVILFFLRVLFVRYFRTRFC